MEWQTWLPPWPETSAISASLTCRVGGIGVAHLAHALDDLQHALDMGLRKLAARGVGRQASAHAQRAGCDETAALAFLAEAVVLELRQHHVGEAVVDLRGVDIVEARAPAMR